MKTIFLIALAVLPIIYATADNYILSDEFIDEINSMQSSWKAGKNPNFNITKDSIRGMLGLVKRPQSLKRNFKVKHHEDVTAIPESFDAREQWKECTSITEIVDQSACGSCWAVATASSMSDRVCIFSEGKSQIRISANHIMSCCILCGDGCNGGEPIFAWDYWRTDGITTGGVYGSTTGCQQYPFEQCEHHGANGSYDPCPADIYATPDCKSTCDSKDNTFELTYGQDSYLIKGEADIQAEILKNGPVVADFDVYEDFLVYTSGVYTYTKGELLGGHAVRILGWGVQDKQKYWLVANSWNEDWGETGLFKMVRGTNNCGFEAECSGGIPNLSY